MGKAAKEIPADKVLKDCTVCPEMVIVPAGSYEMGSPASEEGRNATREGPQHRVTVKSFALARTEVTRGQFAAFVAATGHVTGDECLILSGSNWEETGGINWRNPGYDQQDDHPVVCINWDDAKSYVRWLSQISGKQFRLPSESEWEYAARAGVTTARYWGESPFQACQYAKVADQSTKARVSGTSSWTFHSCNDGYAYTAPAGSFKPNAFGLNDMLGNVWEWMEDCWNENYNGAPSNGSAWTRGDCGRRVLRGGSWGRSPQVVRTANRGWLATDNRHDSIGFRLARTLP